MLSVSYTLQIENKPCFCLKRAQIISNVVCVLFSCAAQLENCFLSSHFFCACKIIPSQLNTFPSSSFGITGTAQMIVVWQNNDCSHYYRCRSLGEKVRKVREVRKAAISGQGRHLRQKVAP